MNFLWQNVKITLDISIHFEKMGDTIHHKMCDYIQEQLRIEASHDYEGKGIKQIFKGSIFCYFHQSCNGLSIIFPRT